MDRRANRPRRAWFAVGAIGTAVFGAQACDGGPPKVFGDDGSPAVATGGQSASGGAATGGASTGNGTGGSSDAGGAGATATSTGGSQSGGAPSGGDAGAPTGNTCQSHDDCEDNEFCDGSKCQADVCTEGETQCAGDGVAQCNEPGSGFGDPEACPEGQTCVETDGTATCAESSTGTGGAGGDGGGAQAGGGNTPPGDCTTATLDPCSGIPELEGTQTVDGEGDDLCGVPSFELDFKNGVVNDWANESPYTESAVVRVAWSSSGLHLFVAVTDSSVNAWQNGDNLWDADGIEVLMSTNTGGNGDVGADSEALHVAASWERAVTVKSGTPTPMTTGHKGKKTADGYTIELQLPWQGDPPSTGSEIRFDIALNAANGEDADTWRDAQALLTRGNVSGNSPCGDDVQPYCDERTWCTTTLE